jgi:hypothetical protein
MKSYILCYSIIIYLCGLVHAEGPFSINIGIENGYFQSETLGDRLLIRLISRINYSQKFENNFINLKGRFSPELYGSSFDAAAYKFNGEIELGGNIKSFHWLANLSTRNYFYRSNRFDNVTFNVFQINISLNRPVSEKNNLGILIDYYYRDNAEQPRSQLDNYRLAVSELYRINKSNFISFDVALEKYLINRDSTIYIFNENEGVRWGPVLSFNHRSGQIINASYELMHHQSDLFGWEYWEHRIHLLWGRYVTKRISAFLFINYLFRPDQHPEDEYIDLAYTAANNETGYHIKLGYDFTRRMEIYIKTGYTKDELLYQRTNLDGWQYLAGMNYRF